MWNFLWQQEKYQIVIYISVVFISSIYLSEHMSRIYAWLPAVSYQRMAAIGLAADVFYAYVFNE